MTLVIHDLVRKNRDEGVPPKGGEYSASLREVGFFQWRNEQKKFEGQNKNLHHYHSYNTCYMLASWNVFVHNNNNTLIERRNYPTLSIYSTALKRAPDMLRFTVN